MIRQDEVFKIGKFIKPHGLKGEITLEFDNDIFDRSNSPYLVCDIDGILVPFFIKEYRFKGKESALITFEDVKSEDKAKIFKGRDVFYPKKYSDGSENDQVYVEYFIDFELIDNQLGSIGTIIDVDDSTINTLFLVKGLDGQDIIVPASDEIITEIDEENKTIHVDLPIGLID